MEHIFLSKFNIVSLTGQNIKYKQIAPIIENKDIDKIRSIELYIDNQVINIAPHPIHLAKFKDSLAILIDFILYFISKKKRNFCQ